MAGSQKPGWGLSERQEGAAQGVGSGDCLLLWKPVLSPLLSQDVMLVSLRAQPPSCDGPQPGLGKKSCIHPPRLLGGRAGEWGMGLQGGTRWA